MKLLLLLMVGILAFGSSESPQVAEARRQWDQVRQQVAAGLLPAAKLQEAQQAIDDAADQEVLDETLYGKMHVEDLNPAQASEMTAAAQRRVDRIEQQIEHGTILISNGSAPARFNDPLEAELARREQALHQAKDRATLVESILNMANEEAAAAESTLPVDKKVEEIFAGDQRLAPQDIKNITLAFEKKFDKPLPVSARGETAVHRALGFDHTGRIDVALAPDSTEGTWLRKYLESRDIPYYAFRAAVPGKLPRHTYTSVREAPGFV